jgi:Flp pilus assembly protein TadD
LVKDAAGRNVEQTDASGNTVYHTPTKQEMLNDIIRTAKVDENVANALRRYAKAATSGANDPEFE